MHQGGDETQRALGAATIAVVFWGIGPLMVRGIDASAATIVFWRFALAQPVMIGASYYFGKGLSLRLIRRALLHSRSPLPTRTWVAYLRLQSWRLWLASYC